MSRVADKLIKAKTASGAAAGGFSVAAVVDTTSNVRILDVQDVTNITVTSSTSAGVWTNFQAVNSTSDGTYLYAINGQYNNCAINSYDVSDETNISLADTLSGQNSVLNGLTHVAGDWDNGFLFVSTSNNYDLHVYDISDPTDMVKVQTYTNSNYAGFPYSTVVDSANLNVYLINYVRGKISSFSYNASSGALTPLSTLSSSILDGLYQAIDLDNQVIYVMDILQKRLTSVDISNPSSMSVLDNITISGGSNFVTIDVVHQLAFVGRDTIYCIDISDPSNLTQLSTISITDNTAIDFIWQMQCDTDREYLFAAGSHSGKIVVIDYSDTSSLSVAGTTATSTVVSHRTLSLIR